MPALAATLPVYLDHHATTPCEPRVVAAMVPHLSETYGNASSRRVKRHQQAQFMGRSVPVPAYTPPAILTNREVAWQVMKWR